MLRRFIYCVSFLFFLLSVQDASAAASFYSKTVKVITTQNSYLIAIQMPNPKYCGEPGKYSPMRIMEHYLGKNLPYLAAHYALLADPSSYDELYLFKDDRIDLNNYAWRYPLSEQVKRSNSFFFKKYNSLFLTAHVERRYRVIEKIPAGSSLLITYEVYGGIIVDMFVHKLKSKECGMNSATVVDNNIITYGKNKVLGIFGKTIVDSHFPRWMKIVELA